MSNYTADVWNANYGVTLPAGTNATHNAATAPLFITRSGYLRDNRTAQGRGSHVRISSINSGKADKSVLFIEVANNFVWPSNSESRIYTFSLRCLVSTN